MSTVLHTDKKTNRGINWCWLIDDDACRLKCRLGWMIIGSYYPGQGFGDSGTWLHAHSFNFFQMYKQWGPFNFAAECIFSTTHSSIWLSTFLQVDQCSLDFWITWVQGEHKRSIWWNNMVLLIWFTEVLIRILISLWWGGSSILFFCETPGAHVKSHSNCNCLCPIS